MENMDNDLIKEYFPNENNREVDLRTYSPLTLAFIGDAVFSLIIRDIVVRQGNRPPEKLHKLTSKYVCAGAQARIGKTLLDMDVLSDDERDVYRRGRNANPNHKAKNATEDDYLEATALEALCGWLYLRGENERLLELVSKGMGQTHFA